MRLRKVTLAFNKELIEDTDGVFNVFHKSGDILVDWNGRKVSGHVTGNNVYDFIYEVPDQIDHLDITIVAVGLDSSVRYHKEFRLYTTDVHTILPIMYGDVKHFR